MNKSTHALYLTLTFLVTALSTTAVVASEKATARTTTKTVALAGAYGGATVLLNRIGVGLINIVHKYNRGFNRHRCLKWEEDFKEESCKKEVFISSDTKLVMTGRQPSAIKAALHAGRLAHLASLGTFLLAANQGLKLYKLYNTDVPKNGN